MNGLDRERMQDYSGQLKHHLENGVIPFWLERAWDEECGGFLTCFDRSGRLVEAPQKHIVSQARLVWWFSTISRRWPLNTEYKDLASRGASWLIDHFWDGGEGGWYWSVTRNGEPLDKGKIVYGQSFAMYALCEYALGSGELDAAEYASCTFDLLQKHAADTYHGGYYENLESDWQIASSQKNCGGDRKSLDTHMHLMESFTTLLELTSDSLHRRKLLEVVELIMEQMIDLRNGCGRNQFRSDFTPIPAIAIRRTWNWDRLGESPEEPTDTTSYGHNVELEWLMHRAVETASVPLGAYRTTWRSLLDHAVEHGVDWENGGVYRDGTRAGGALIVEKEFWQQAEALVGFLDGYELFRDERYLDAFACCWRFVKDHLIADCGEWHTLCDREGTVIDGSTGSVWKVSYHSGRSMLECIERLQRMIPVSTAG